MLLSVLLLTMFLITFAYVEEISCCTKCWHVCYFKLFKFHMDYFIWFYRDSVFGNENRNLSDHKPNLCAYSETLVPGKAVWTYIYFSDFPTSVNEPTPILALTSPQYTKYVMGNNFSRSARLVGKHNTHLLGPYFSKFCVGCQVEV